MLYIGVGNFFFGGGVHVFFEKVGDFLVVALKTQPKTAELTTPTLQIFSANKILFKKLDSCSASGALTIFPCKLGPKIFSAQGVHVHPLATPMILYDDW